MKKSVIKVPRISWLLCLWLAIFSVRAYAAGPGVTSNDVLDNVLLRFSNVASTWGTIITTRASWLFWLLVLISMVWTFGFMALRKADIGEFFAEFIKFTLFVGFFWWLLLNGPKFATDIMMSLRMIAAEASGLAKELGPSGIVDIGFDIFYKVVDQSSVWKPIDTLFGLLLSMAILIVFALVGVNMLLLLISAWIFAYAGVFILGFGGSRWTSDMAIGYFKSILNIGLQLMTMVLLVGIGKSFVDQYYTAMSAGITLKQLAVMAVVAAILLALVAKVPPQIGALAGGTTGNLGSNFGVGAAVGAAAMAGASIATAGAAIVAGAAGAAGGAQALMAAHSKASAAESAGGGGSLLTAAGSGGGGDSGGGGGSALAAAMGDSGASSAGAGRSGTDSVSSATKGGSAGSTDSGGAASGGETSPGAQGAAASSSKEQGSPSEVKRGGMLGAAGAMAARAGKVAAGTAANLAVGSWDVAKGKGADLKAGAMARISETTGGKIAAAIETRGAMDKAAKFGDDSLSAAADDKAVDAESEIAAFRDRGSKSS